MPGSLCLIYVFGTKAKSETEMVTPPGHIYVRFKKGNSEINIETTARGVHLDSEEYLGIETRGLQKRTVKEVIGLTHFNQASVYWQQENRTRFGLL